MSNVRDELQRWVDGVDATHEDGLADLTHDVIPVDLARRVLDEMDGIAYESECRRVTYANLYVTYLATRNEKWSNECAPGGMVCAECGVPVESESCELHGGGLDVAEKVRGQMHEALNRVTDITIERDAALATLAEVRELRDEYRAYLDSGQNQDDPIGIGPILSAKGVVHALTAILDRSTP